MMTVAVNVTVTLTGTVAADVPWLLLDMVCATTRKECKELFLAEGGGSLPPTTLTHHLHKALEHAAGLLHETAVNEIYVSCQHMSGAAEWQQAAAYMSVECASALRPPLHCRLQEGRHVQGKILQISMIFQFCKFRGKFILLFMVKAWCWWLPLGTAVPTYTIDSWSVPLQRLEEGPRMRLGVAEVQLRTIHDLTASQVDSNCNGNCCRSSRAPHALRRPWAWWG
jgi:hypothetical protein